MKKQIYAIIFVFVCLIFLTIATSAQTIPAKRLLPRLVDESGLLTKDRAAGLLEKLDEISERQKCDVVVVTVNSLDGKRSDAYADDFFDYNGYGMGKGYDGVLLLVCLEEQEWAISTCGFAITAFTDAKQAEMSRSFMGYLNMGDYEKAFGRFAELCDEILTEANASRPFTLSSFSRLLPAALIIGVILSFVITSAMKAKLKSVRSQPAAGTYLRTGSLNISQSSDVFLYKTVSKKARSSSSGSSGSSTHRSSSGRSHGGSRGKF